MTPPTGTITLPMARLVSTLPVAALTALFLLLYKHSFVRQDFAHATIGPMILFAVAVPSYVERTKMEKITQNIPRADAKWLGQRLSTLTGDQIREGFRAGGYGVADVEMLTRAIRKRIAALEAL